MKDPLEIGKRPYIVVEGIYEPFFMVKHENHSLKRIVYTGKLDNRFGIMNLISAFSSIKDDNLRLVICGNGEERENVELASKKDHRIEYKGQVSSDEARAIIVNADILVNPRQNDSDYTKYSFPSKIIDYLSTGNSVIAYKLDGMPAEYSNFIYFVPDNSIESLAKMIFQVLNTSCEARRIRSTNALVYLNDQLNKKNVGKRILLLNGFEL